MQKTITPHIMIASIALIAVMGAGCTADEPLAGTSTSAQSSSVPSFTRIDDALALEGKDEAVVKEALDEWRRGAATGNATRPFMQRREQEMTFVAAVAPSLDDRQLTNLVNLLVAQRQEQRASREDRDKGNRMEMLARQLDLTADQQKAMKQLHQETRAQAQTKRDAFKSGTLTEDELHTQVKAVHDASREKMATILSAEQMAKLDALREDGVERRRERRSGNSDDRVEHFIGWLDAALELSDEQTAQAKTAMTTMTQAQTTVHQAKQAGTITREQAREQMRAAHATFEDALTTILTADQEKRLAILAPLRPGRHHHA